MSSAEKGLRTKMAPGGISPGIGLAMPDETWMPMLGQRSAVSRARSKPLRSPGI